MLEIILFVSTRLGLDVVDDANASAASSQVAETIVGTEIERVRNSVAIVLAQTAVDVKNSDGNVIAELAQQAIEKYQTGPIAVVNRQEPHDSNVEADGNTKTKKV